MPDNPPTTLEQHVAALLRLILEQQAGLCACLAYLRAQPTYDADLMARLYEDERAKLLLPPGQSLEMLAAMRRFLEEFQGPKQ